MIPYGKQDINQQDIDAVIDVLKSDFLTQGPQVPAFEQAMQKQCNAKHAIAVNSATSALHIACLALGVSKGDLVWTTPISFVASANCALYCGASVDFVDIDAVTYNLCSAKLEEKLIYAKANNLQLPKVLILVHLSGEPCEMLEISKLAKEYHFSIIEDASHAIGSEYKGNKIGSCQFSNITVFSFHPVKIITAGEGGVATTNDVELADKMLLFRGHGITRDTQQMVGESHGDWYYQQITLGYNYRMTELQAALGLSQLNRLEAFVERRNVIAEYYDQELQNLPIHLPTQKSEHKSSRHLYIIRLELQKISHSHKGVFNAIREKGVGVNLHYIPIHLQPYYQGLGFKEGDFPTAEKYYREAISIPLYPQMSEMQLDEVCAVLRIVLV
ncbi:MAG: UDP-4-amino-4,6-dideoxy-N-acetyl-beta-L-altrosamine transaminase [Gammaproteobacteria bacterium]|nr:MAG: UDP-4-amino-4,6-dideoxy-N-acetyl-beta-L-altrosamine transaminase [Gammaproteobacteria bacterium]